MTTFSKKIKEHISNNYYLFIIFTNIRAYSLYYLNRISGYSLEKRRFYTILGYKVNLRNPKTFNEKIMWKKIYDRNPLLSVTADKYEVRSYVKEILGEKKAKEILIPLLYVTDKPENIPFDELPIPFIIKPNHSSGRYIIVKNRNYNKKEIVRVCRKWLKTPFGLEKLEWAYQPIKRKIVIEKLLLENGDIPKDFKFHMFHGKCESVKVFLNRMTNHFTCSFDHNWNCIPNKDSKQTEKPKIEKPKNYEFMLEYAEKLSKPFDYVRVDFYNIDGKIYFGELTHYPKSGLIKSGAALSNYEPGKYWSIIPKYWEN